MISFFFKKSFYDGWDNLLWIIFFNLLIVAITVFGLFATQALSSFHMLIGVPLFILFVCLDMIVLFAVNEGCAKLVNFKTMSYKETFAKIKDVWKDAVLFGLLVSFLTILVVIGIPFYLSYGNFIGLFFAAIIFWVVVLVFLALQWFLPLYSQLHGGFKKTLKKTFILLFDNTGFTIILFVYSVFMLVLSVVIAFLAPGPVGICMAQNNALKLRMKKYDWLEEHPEISPKEARKKVPWDEILDKDKEIVGNRTFRNLIFPWKD